MDYANAYETAPLFDLIWNDTLFKYPYHDHSHRFKRSADEFFDNKNNIAMYIVAPILFLVFGSCCGIYCCYKCREYMKENDPVKNIKAKFKSAFIKTTPRKDAFLRELQERSRPSSVHSLKLLNTDVPNLSFEKQKSSPNIRYFSNSNDLDMCLSTDGCSMYSPLSTVTESTVLSCSVSMEEHPFEINSPCQRQYPYFKPKSCQGSQKNSDIRVENDATPTSEHISSFTTNIKDERVNQTYIESNEFVSTAPSDGESKTIANHDKEGVAFCPFPNQIPSSSEEQQFLSTIFKLTPKNKTERRKLISLEGSVSNAVCEPPLYSSPDYIQHNARSNINSRETSLNDLNPSVVNKSSDNSFQTETLVKSVSQLSPISDVSISSNEKRNTPPFFIDYSTQNSMINTAFNIETNHSGRSDRIKTSNTESVLKQNQEDNSVVNFRISRNESTIYTLMAESGIRNAKNKGHGKTKKDKRIVDHWKR